jgi:Macrocin-O-methyltransferase (TylF)
MAGRSRNRSVFQYWADNLPCRLNAERFAADGDWRYIVFIGLAKREMPIYYWEQHNSNPPRGLAMETREIAEDKVVHILRLRATGVPDQDICREYGISLEALNSLLSRSPIGAPTASTSKIRKLSKKSPAQIVASIRWHANFWTHKFIYKVLFNTVLWAPKKSGSCFLAYYPLSVNSFANRMDLYRSWIRGDKTGKNGDASRFIGLILNLRQLLAEKIDGDFAELGVWKGNSAAILVTFAAQSGKRLFLFDTFAGFDRRDFIGDDKDETAAFGDTSIDFVREAVGHNEITTYVKGYFPDSITAEVSERRYALVHLDCDLYAPMKAALEFFYPRMPQGGMLIMHDYSSGLYLGATHAIDEFCKTVGEYPTLWPDKLGTAIIRKSR